MIRIRVDLPLLFSILGLIGLGVVMVYSSSWVLSEKEFQDCWHYAERQAIFAGLAVVALSIGVWIEPHFYQKYVYLILLTTLFFLIIVLIPGIGNAAGIARRWIAIGPFNLQAGELAKIALLVYLAASLSKKAGRMTEFKIGILPHAIIPGTLIGLLLLEPDFGTAMMLFFVTTLMLFVGGARVRYLIAGGVVSIPFLISLVTSSPYRMKRILAFLDPWAHRSDIGYQVTESLMTFGSGGILGMGLGEGKQKMFFLPAGHTDFIFANIGEELGLAGVLAVLLAYTVIFFKGLWAAIKLEDSYKSYLAFGISLTIILQAIFNMAVVVGLVPTKGITLPFISYGGSSLIVSAFLAGILLRLTGEAKAIEEERREDSR
jgi:cell division protein FtsW